MKNDETDQKLKKHDRSELSLYEARIYEAMGNHTKALVILQNETVIVNSVARNENLARIY